MLKPHRHVKVGIALALLALVVGGAVAVKEGVFGPRQSVPETAPVVEADPLYHERARDIAERYEALVDSPEASEIERLRQDILSLRVSADDKDAHLALFRAISMLAESTESNDSSLRQESLSLMASAREKYPWLN